MNSKFNLYLGLSSFCSLEFEEGEWTLTQSPSDSHHGIAVSAIQRCQKDSSACCTQHHRQNKAETDSTTQNTHRKAPRKARARHQPKDKCARSSNRPEMQQGKKMENKSEPVFIPSVSREIFRAQGARFSSIKKLVTSSQPASQDLWKDKCKWAKGSNYRDHWKSPSKNKSFPRS